MKWLPGIMLGLCISLAASAQEPEEMPFLQEQVLENLAEKEDREIEDDSNWQNLEYYRSKPLDLNRVTAEELQSLQMLSALQIESFIHYRMLLGNLLSVYELQAVPGWDAMLVRNILPFVKVSDQASVFRDIGKSWKQGNASLLLRVGQTLEQARGYKKSEDSLGSHYLGSPQRLFFRYDYRLLNKMQYGLLGEKDPGEPFFQGKQKAGFDFYSFHLFLRNRGRLKSLALGDFTVNLGQGLIQWQGRASTKSADVMAIKRQSARLLPYHSSGEYNFFRGAGITMVFRKLETTVFVSHRLLSGNLVTDTAERVDFVSSLQDGGYHRTQAENEDRNNTGRISAGAAVRYNAVMGQVGLNAIFHRFSRKVEKPDDPYNLFAWKGYSSWNFSTDYGFSYRNAHHFGEIALDQDRHFAMVHGTMISLGAAADASVLFRHIGRAYHAVDANAFTENSAPTNETGWYMGFQLRPAAGWQLSLYYDGYRFPWLRYRADYPGYGRDYLLQVNYQPNKEFSIHWRFSNRAKTANAAGSDSATHNQVLNARKDAVLSMEYKINRIWEIRSRVQAVWVGKMQTGLETGFLGLIDLYYKPGRAGYAINARLQYFETGGYDTRIYLFERDVLFGYSLPAFSDKGLRYYLNLQARIKHIFSKKMQVDGWLRWAGSVYPGKSLLGTGLDEIKGNHKEEIKCQLIIKWIN